MTGFFITGAMSSDTPTADPLTLAPKENPTVNLSNNLTVKANGDIAKGTPVAYYQFDGTLGVMEVKPANQLVELAVGISGQAISHGLLGPLIRTGTVSGIDTSTYSTNDVLYVGTGSLTNVEPATGHKQMIAQVLDVGVSGSILVDTNFFIPSASSIKYGDTDIGQALEQSIVESKLNAVKQAIIFG